jgi:hypothetical protein
MAKSIKFYSLIAVILIVGVGLVLSALLHRSEYARYTDPTGNYVAVVSYRTILSFIPMMPGQSGDKPGFVEVFKKGEGSLGRIPVAMLQLAQVSWEKPGAVVRLAGEWDFERRTCWYWDQSGNRKMYVRD